MKKLIAILLAVVLCLSMVACASSTSKQDSQTADNTASDTKADTSSDASTSEDTSSDDAASTGKTGVLKIGAIHDLTGSGSVLGIAGVNGHKLAVNDINAAGGVVIGDTTYTLELIAYDCKSDPNEAISAMNRLVTVDDVAIIEGPSLSNIGLACVDTTNELQVPFLGQFGDPRCMTGENYDSLNPYMFLMQPSATQSGIQSLSYLVEKLGCKKIGFLIAQDHAYCVAQTLKAFDYLDQMGVDYVVEYNNQADIDMKTQLTNLMNAGCDGLFNANPTQPLTVSTNQKHQLGWEVPQTGSLDFSSPFASLCADNASASHIYFMSNTAYDTENFIELDKKCRETFDQEATIKTALGYDQILITVAAAQAAGSIDRNAIRDALENISGVKTVITDNFCMNPEDHMPIGLEVCIMEIENGEYSVAEPVWSPDYLK